MDSAQKLIRPSEIPRVYQSITSSNLNAIQPTAHKISCSQAFWVAILENALLWHSAKNVLIEYILIDIGHIGEK